MSGLTLTRNVDQSLIIILPDGATIKVRLVSTTGRQAQINIDAPRDCEILREELLKKKNVDK